MAALLGTIMGILFVSVPLGISTWALLDITRRPRWAWAMSERHQVIWLAAVLCGFLTVIGGVIISSWYLVRVRPVVAAAEDGRVR